MSDAIGLKDNIARMWEEAELYESQGLFAHALEVYQNILDSDPENRKAQVKLVQLQFSLKMDAGTDSQSIPTEELTPRQGLDLGIAYMGMNLYAEALQEFRQALKSSPAVRNELARHITACLIHLQRFEDARKMIDQFMADPTLTVKEKGDFVSEIAGLCLDLGVFLEASYVLGRITDEMTEFVPDYYVLLDRLSAGDKTGDQFEVMGDDTTGELVTSDQRPDYDTEIFSESQIGSDTESVFADEGPSIPWKTPISFTQDNKNWTEGSLVRLSADWALIDVDRSLRVGESILLRLALPISTEDNVAWIVTKVVRIDSAAGKSDALIVKVDFLSFLPGGDSLLKSFMDQVAADPSILDASPEPVPLPDDDKDDGAYDALQQEAVKALEAHQLDQPPDDSVILETQEERPPKKKKKKKAKKKRKPRPKPVDIEKELDDAEVAFARNVSFACKCGQVHTVPRTLIGRKGKCLNCAEAMVVPVVDERPDGITRNILGESIGGCRILYKLGGGGMGGVYKAHHVALDIPVAIKILYAHLAEKDPVFIKRFIREARSAARLQHPNIVGVMNVGFEGGFHFLVMPYVGGGSAAALLGKKGRFSLEETLDIAIQMARALSVAEENNILHRDVKPANIILTEKGEAKLADLGLAKNYHEGSDSHITQTGIACGTPLYFSPEQAKGAQDLDIRSDIYSLGISLYHLLEGIPPFVGESAYVIFQKHVHDPLPPFRNAKDIPEAVFRLLQKMSAKKPADRFSSAAELLDVLETLKEEVVDSKKSNLTRKSLLERLGITRS